MTRSLSRSGHRSGLIGGRALAGLVGLGLLFGPSTAAAGTFSFARQDYPVSDLPSAGALFRAGVDFTGHNIAVGDFDGKNGPDIAVSAFAFTAPPPNPQRIRVEVFLNKGDGV